MAAKKRDYSAEYRRRKAKGLAKGLTLQEAAGHAKRQRAAPASGLSPVGGRLAGARTFPPCMPAVDMARWLYRLASDTRVFVFGVLWEVYTEELLAAGEDIDIEQLYEESPCEALAVAREVEDDGLSSKENVAVWPNGGIRAGTLRQLVNAHRDGLTGVLLEEVGAGRYRAGANPAVNPKNRREKSPMMKKTGKASEVFHMFERLTVQWQR